VGCLATPSSFCRYFQGSPLLDLFGRGKTVVFAGEARDMFCLKQAKNSVDAILNESGKIIG
jgi:hypothetical protein